MTARPKAEIDDWRNLSRRILNVGKFHSSRTVSVREKTIETLNMGL